MTPRHVAAGIVILALATAIAVLFLPAITAPVTPSDIFRPYTALELKGRAIYVANGCTYCHTQYIRPSDWGYTPMRVSQPGDYIEDHPQLLGAHRTGPDLAQEGGMHPDDWHEAHFHDPRFVRPVSVMPDFAFLGPDSMQALIAYVQSLGGKMADARVQRQKRWKAQLLAAWNRGEDANADYLYDHVPSGWRAAPNPYPPTPAALARGQFIYQQECIYCHGPVGDGNGPAATYLEPKPFNFTLLKRHPWSGAMIYYQIMNGITGSAMPFFKDDLHSAEIWDVSNYVAVEFIGTNIDSNLRDNGIDASREPARTPGATEPPYLGPIPLPFNTRILATPLCCPKLPQG